MERFSKLTPFLVAAALIAVMGQTFLPGQNSAPPDFWSSWHGEAPGNKMDVINFVGITPSTQVQIYTFGNGITLADFVSFSANGAGSLWVAMDFSGAYSGWTSANIDTVDGIPIGGDHPTAGTLDVFCTGLRFLSTGATVISFVVRGRSN